MNCYAARVPRGSNVFKDCKECARKHFEVSATEIQPRVIFEVQTEYLLMVTTSWNQQKSRGHRWPTIQQTIMLSLVMQMLSTASLAAVSCKSGLLALVKPFCRCIPDRDALCEMVLMFDACQ